MIKQSPSWASRKNKNSNSKRYLHLNIHSSIAYNRTKDMEATQVSIDRRICKEVVVFVYAMEYYSVIKRMNYCQL